ncbi:GTP cyclohydrolase III [Aeropyrum pernix K1]|uniref:GTP cyclohydrolase III n=1 Tax=Aeropyrum pernix (strain ATCC 700893 / DSM 11879 / JCM 9820 / NBRC 100138 / K1) TaxID=272557 RepID=GCH3_AERPE|nr:GTP cyclohydrolase IIa [Aeropyrum pernix]Q9YC89.2 RecName: Full=GTP cyclohydrolase III [Aeropyrum pernix K1]BAA80359.2 GTP cyclohydrolase III [Aeropyrum pernix K1]
MDAKKAVRVAVVEQVGYREWTEELGSDREWIIQTLQSDIYAAAQKEAAGYGGFVLPIRYDIMLLISSNMGVQEHARVLDAIAGLSKVKVRMASYCGVKPLDAVERAWNALRRREERLIYERCEGEEYTAIAHIDLNNVTAITRAEGPVRTYYEVMDLMAKISKVAEKIGAITQYLGGDNILAVLPLNGSVKETVDMLLVRSDLKAGIGIAPTARASLALAAEALHEIRSKINPGPLVVKAQ